MSFAAIESTLNSTALAVFSNAVASIAGASADVTIDRDTQDAYQTARANRWTLQMPAGALALSVGTAVTITGAHAGSYKVLDVDLADAMITVVTLGAT